MRSRNRPHPTVRELRWRRRQGMKAEARVEALLAVQWTAALYEPYKAARRAADAARDIYRRVVRSRIRRDRRRFDRDRACVTRAAIAAWNSRKNS